jgi:hypothetical protein
MTHTWHHAPGSKQHWLYRGTSSASGVRGMIYEVNPNAFTVCREFPQQTWDIARREFIAQVPTLEEAQGLLVTIVSSRIGENA